MPRTTRNSLHAAYYAGDIAPYHLPFVVTAGINPMSANHGSETAGIQTAGIETPNSDDFETAGIQTADSEHANYVPMSPTSDPVPQLDRSLIHAELTLDGIAAIIHDWLKEQGIDYWTKYRHRSHESDDGTYLVLALRIFPQGPFSWYAKDHIISYATAINGMFHAERMAKIFLVQVVDNEDDYNKLF